MVDRARVPAEEIGVILALNSDVVCQQFVCRPVTARFRKMGHREVVVNRQAPSPAPNNIT